MPLIVITIGSAGVSVEVTSWKDVILEMLSRIQIVMKELVAPKEIVVEVVVKEAVADPLAGRAETITGRDPVETTV